MNKNLLIAASVAAFVCGCQSEAPKQDKKQEQNSNERRTQKPQGGCCETEKTQPSAPAQAAQPAPSTQQVVQPTPVVQPVQPVQQQNQTVATPEVRTEKAK